MPYIVKRSMTTLGTFYCFMVSRFPIISLNYFDGHLRSPESLSSFKVIPFPLLLLISALLMTEVFLNRSRCFGQLTGLFVCLTVF